MIIRHRTRCQRSSPATAPRGEHRPIACRRKEGTRVDSHRLHPSHREEVDHLLARGADTAGSAAVRLWLGTSSPSRRQTTSAGRA